MGLHWSFLVFATFNLHIFIFTCVTIWFIVLHIILMLICYTPIMLTKTLWLVSLFIYFFWLLYLYITVCKLFFIFYLIRELLFLMVCTEGGLECSLRGQLLWCSYFNLSTIIYCFIEVINFFFSTVFLLSAQAEKNQSIEQWNYIVVNMCFIVSKSK